GRVPASVRAALHLRASEVLRTAGAPAERVGEHLAAGAAMDRTAIDWLNLNADRLIVRAPRLAVTLLRRALADIEAESVAELRLHLIRALLWEGDAAEAEQVARTALAAARRSDRERPPRERQGPQSDRERPPRERQSPQSDRERSPRERQSPRSDQEGKLRWLLAQACYRQGRLPETLEVVQEAIASPTLTPGEIGRFQGFLALCRTVMFQFPETVEAAREAIRLGEAANDAVAMGYGYSLLAGVDLVQTRYEEGLEFAGHAIAAFGGGVRPDLQMDPYYLRGFMLARLDRFDEADRALAASEQQNLDRGGIYGALSSLVRTRMRVLDGRWDDALAQIRTGLEVFDPYNYGLPMHSLAVIVAVHRGTFGETDEVPVDDGSPGARSSRFLLVWAQALAAEARTGPQQALDLLYPVWADGGVMEAPGGIYDICPDLARLAAATQDRERARELAVSTNALATTLPNSTTRAIAALCGGIARDDAELLGEAAQAFRDAGRPLFEAYAWEHRAELLALAGDSAGARAALEEARNHYTTLDAAWDASRADARLRPLGIRRGVTGPRKRPKQGWEALTETETKVALLVADGRSNPDIAAQMFLSRRTVQSHVSSILAKLGLKSRVEIAIHAYSRAPV
ncbi:helix-turn-helix transcriptional regulator, partial [Allorhizocola rhizosphaerae]|uniref:helix-turn-helix transcriptional regulator n=1 Tax=Allorhizocola rhizosphaerae TaxID=1872709 RepID=UPI0013C30537